MKIEEIIPGIIKVNEFPDIEVANIEYDIMRMELKPNTQI